MIRLGGLVEFEHDAVGVVEVGHLAPVGQQLHRVTKANASCGQPRHLAVDVVDDQAKVLPAARGVGRSERRVDHGRREELEELDDHPVEIDAGDEDARPLELEDGVDLAALPGRARGPHELGAQHPAVEGQRALDVADGHAQMGGDHLDTSLSPALVIPWSHRP
jgi:hypothetical protein